MVRAVDRVARRASLAVLLLLRATRPVCLGPGGHTAVISLHLRKLLPMECTERTKIKQKARADRLMGKTDVSKTARVSEDLKC